MALARRNKQRMYYSLYSGTAPVYETDENGDVVYIEVDGEQVPVEVGTTVASYGTPVEFRAGISSHLNELKMRAWGVDQSAVYSEIVVQKNYLPREFGIGTVVWRESEIVYEDAEKTIPKQSSSDYTVCGIMTEGLNEDHYLLQRNSSDAR